MASFTKSSLHLSLNLSPTVTGKTASIQRIQGVGRGMLHTLLQNDMARIRGKHGTGDTQWHQLNSLLSGLRH